ncbi:dentin sialophosphoprotein-like [Scylla paramamosain]|uniref:dentin sialophosphoprotein-like n=1 Tax=Scylla paramamosain TaxID=85552 RepID=UPI003082C088
MKLEIALVFFVGLALKVAECHELPSWEVLESKRLEYKQRLQRLQTFLSSKDHERQTWALQESSVKDQNRLLDVSLTVQRLQAIAHRSNRDLRALIKTTKKRREAAERKAHENAKLQREQKAALEGRLRSTKLQLQKAQEKQAASGRALLQRAQTEATKIQATLEEAANLRTLTQEIDAATEMIRAHQEWRDNGRLSWWRRSLSSLFTAMRTSKTTQEQYNDTPQDVGPASLSATDTQSYDDHTDDQPDSGISTDEATETKALPEDNGPGDNTEGDTEAEDAPAEARPSQDNDTYDTAEGDTEAEDAPAEARPSEDNYPGDTAEGDTEAEDAPAEARPSEDNYPDDTTEGDTEAEDAPAEARPSQDNDPDETAEGDTKAEDAPAEARPSEDNYPDDTEEWDTEAEDAPAEARPSQDNDPDNTAEGDTKAEDSPAEARPSQNNGDRTPSTWPMYLCLYAAVSVAITVARMNAKCRTHHRGTP